MSSCGAAEFARGSPRCARPPPGRGPCARAAPARSAGGSSASTVAPPGTATSRQRPRAARTGWSRNAATSLTPAQAMPMPSRSLRISSASERAIRSATTALSSSRWATRSEPVAKRGSSASSGRPRNWRTGPSTRARSGWRTAPPCRRRPVKAPYGAMVACWVPRRGGWLPAVARVVGGLAHPLGQCLEQRHLHRVRRAGGGAGVQGGQDAAVGVHPGGDVGDGDPDPGGLLGGAGQRHQARLALHQQVVRLAVGPRPVGAVPGDRARDQPRPALGERVHAQAQPVGRARSQVLDEHVGAVEEFGPGSRRPRGSFRSSVRDSLERLSHTK